MRWCARLDGLAGSSNPPPLSAPKMPVPHTPPITTNTAVAPSTHHRAATTVRPHHANIDELPGPGHFGRKLYT